MEGTTHADVLCTKNNLSLLFIGSIVFVTSILLSRLSLIDCIHARTIMSVSSSMTGGHTLKVNIIRVFQPAHLSVSLGFNMMFRGEYAIIIKSQLLQEHETMFILMVY